MGVMSSRTSVDRFCGDEGILISPDFTPPTTTDLAAACAKRLVQYAFIEDQCGPQDVDWEFSMQRLQFDGKRPFDVMTITMIDESTRSFWFDITAFFGTTSLLLDDY